MCDTLGTYFGKPFSVSLSRCVTNVGIFWDSFLQQIESPLTNALNLLLFSSGPRDRYGVDFRAILRGCERYFRWIWDIVLDGFLINIDMISRHFF